MVSRKMNAKRYKLLKLNRRADLNKKLEARSLAIKKKKENKPKKNKTSFRRSIRRAKLIVKDDGGKYDENEEVEFYGEMVTAAEKKKMEAIIPFLKGYAGEDDLTNFVANFSSFEHEGTLVFKKFKKVNCCLCQKLGHRMEICPRRWKDGKWMEQYTNLEGLMQTSSKQGTKEKSKKERRHCLNCNQNGHTFMKCPELIALYEDE